MTGLPATASTIHRVAHWYASQRLRGAPRIWRAAEWIVPLGGTRQLAVGDVLLTVNTSDVGEVAFYKGLKEQPEMQLAQLLIRPGDHCVDVGANIGIYTALLASRVSNSGSVVAYEPAPWLGARLKSNLCALGNVTIIPLAVGSVRSSARLNRPDNHDGMASLRGDPEFPVMESTTVEVVPLSEEPLPEAVHFLKVDAEGWESEVFRGAMELFRTGRIRASLWEISPCFGDVTCVQGMLNIAGYHLFKLGRRISVSKIRFYPSLEPVVRGTEEAFLKQRQSTMLFLREDAIEEVDCFICR